MPATAEGAARLPAPSIEGETGSLSQKERPGHV